MLNALDRFHPVNDVVDRVPYLAASAGYVKQARRDALLAHRAWVETHGDDLPAIRDWRWEG